jgi:hypothetical protein
VTDLTHQRKSRWYALVAVVVSCILVSVGIGGANAAYTQRTVRSDHHHWCSLLRTLLTPTTAGPSTTPPPDPERTREIISEITALYHDLDCDHA